MAKLALTHTSLHGDSVPLYNGNAQADARIYYFFSKQMRVQQALGQSKNTHFHLELLPPVI